MPANPDAAGFGVYVHWPFCAQKCPYCDFNSHVRPGGVSEAVFLDAFRRELGWVRERTGPRTATSIFIGGGTPSLMSAATVADIIDEIAQLWTLDANAEITLEANPNSVEAGRFAGYCAAGVNRVSIGVQSLRDAELRRLGRLQSVAEAKAALDIARRTFDRWSFDLIYARPQQTIADWRTELIEALDLADGHLSLYQLTIEEGTPFERWYRAGKLVVPGNDLAADLYELTQDMTAAAGLPAYEVSNHARPGEESRHNLLYWRYGEYAGTGPGAHGRIISDGARLATSTERDPDRWLKLVAEHGHGMVELAPVSGPEQADEMLVMGLRLTEGIDLDRLRRLTGAALSSSAIGELTRLGLIDPAAPPGWIRLTPAGRLVTNEIIAQLSRHTEPAAA